MTTLEGIEDFRWLVKEAFANSSVYYNQPRDSFDVVVFDDEYRYDMRYFGEELPDKERLLQDIQSLRDGTYKFP